MAQIGQFALALAWVVTAYSIVASLLGIHLKHDKLVASGRNAALGTFVCITSAIACLGYLFAVSDFSIKYIAAHSNRDLPIYFKVSSIWGGQDRCCSGGGCSRPIRRWSLFRIGENTAR